MVVVAKPTNKKLLFGYRLIDGSRHWPSITNLFLKKDVSALTIIFQTLLSLTISDK